MKRTALALTVVIACISGSAGVARADVQTVNGQLPLEQRQFQENESIWAPTIPGKQTLDYTVRGGGDTIAAPAAISTQHGLCAQVDDACLTGTSSLFMRGYFGDCQKGDPPPCIVGLAARKEGSTDWIQAVQTEQIDYKPSASDVDAWLRGLNSDTTFGTVLEQAGLGTSYPANEKQGTFGSAPGPITYVLPGITNAAGTEQYLVDDRFEFFYSVNPETHSVNPASPTNVWMSIRPFAEVPWGNMPIQGYRYKSATEGGITGSVGSDFYTAYTLKGRTGLAAGFPSGVEFRLEVKVPKSFSTWFHGRIVDPNVVVNQIDANENDLTFSGTPVSEQITSAYVTTDDPLFDLLEPSPDMGAHMKELAAQGVTGAGGFGWSPDGGIDQTYLNWAKLFPQKAKGVGTVWSISTMSGWRTANNPCMKSTDGLQGFLFTNAMAYQASTPVFANGELNYQVAGTHLDSQGNVFQGTYNFIMRDSVARCLYGFRNAPISGTVSVTSSDGAEQVAYTNVTDKDGWLTLSAQGFTFSNPTISAKLSQAPEPTPTPTPKPSESSSPTPTATASQAPAKSKTTITCTKGKLVKKVTGKSPKCPSGYKKKA